MPVVQVTLLGPPSIKAADGSPRPLRGQKSWALLARLVLAERPVPRRDLAAELFPDAVDPLGSVRWCLAAIRKALGTSAAFTGDPIDPTLPDGVVVDVLALRAGTVDPDHVAVGELLQGVDPRCGPEFATWLLVARQQHAGQVDTLLRERVITALSRSQGADAVATAEQLVRRLPFDEGAHVLLVQSLVATGRHEAADAHVDAVEALFELELGVAPGPALRSAARRTLADPPPGVSGATVAATLLEAGRTALAAGATDAGVDCLRRAATVAEHAAERALHAEALLALGGALVRSVRGFDDEGSVLLEQAAQVARDIGSTELAASALYERGYADALAGRRPEAERRLAEAEGLATGNDLLLAGVHATAGFNLADWGRVDAAMDRYEESLECAARAGDDRRSAWVHGLASWALLQEGDVEVAARRASACLDLVGSLHWASFEPLPLAVRAEAERTLGGGDPAARRRVLERGFAMSCELGDPCWEGATGWAMAQLLADEGDLDAAVRWIADARARSLRRSDSWAGLLGSILVTEARLRSDAGDAAGGQAAARDALALAARTHLDGVLPEAVALVGVRVTARAAAHAPIR